MKVDSDEDEVANSARKSEFGEESPRKEDESPREKEESPRKDDTPRRKDDTPRKDDTSRENGESPRKNKDDDIVLSPPDSNRSNSARSTRSSACLLYTSPSPRDS